MSNSIYTELSDTEQISTILLNEIDELSTNVSDLSVNVNTISSNVTTLSIEHNAAIDDIDSKLNDLSAKSDLISAYTTSDNSPISKLDPVTSLDDRDIFIISEPSLDTNTGYISKNVTLGDIKTNIINETENRLNIDSMNETMLNLSNLMSQIKLYDRVQISCSANDKFIISSIVQERGNLISCSGYLFDDAISTYFNENNPSSLVKDYFAPISSDYVIGDSLKISQTSTGDTQLADRYKIDVADRYLSTLSDFSTYYTPHPIDRNMSLGVYEIAINEAGLVVSAQLANLPSVNDVENLSTNLNTKQNIILPESTTTLNDHKILLKGEDNDDFKTITLESLAAQLSDMILARVSCHTIEVNGKDISLYSNNVISNAPFNWVFNDESVLNELSKTDEGKAILGSLFLSSDFSLSNIIDRYRSVQPYLTSVNSYLSTAYNHIIEQQYNITSSATNRKAYLRVSVPITLKSIVTIRLDAGNKTNGTTTQLMKVMRKISLMTCISYDNNMTPDESYKLSIQPHLLGTYAFIGNCTNDSNPLVQLNIAYYAKTNGHTATATASSSRDIKTLRHLNPYALNSRQFIVGTGLVFHIIISGTESPLLVDDANPNSTYEDVYDQSFRNLNEIHDFVGNNDQHFSFSLLGYGPATTSDLTSTTTSTANEGKGKLGVNDLLKWIKLTITPLV